MDGLRPAGGLAKADLRKIQRGSFTVGQLAPVAFAAAATAGLKLMIKSFHPVHLVILALPAIGILFKQALNYSLRHAAAVGVGVHKAHPEVDRLVRSIADYDGVPELKAVGIGDRAEIVVTVKGKRRQKVTVKVGAPLLFSLNAAQLAPLVAYHLAVVDEPAPALACGVLRRRSEFAFAAQSDPEKAERAGALFARTQHFAADLDARGFARAQRAAGSREAAAAALNAARAVADDFAIIEGKFRQLMRDEIPFPRVCYAAWAEARRRTRPPLPGQEPVLATTSVFVDRILLQQWLRRTPRMFFTDVKRLEEDAGYDYSWLLSQVYRDAPQPTWR